MSEPFIVSENLVKIFKVADLEVIALQGLDITINKGEMVGIVGTSGSGKSTFLNIIGGLLTPSAGTITVGGRDLLKATPAELDRYRRDEVGFIWQQSARNMIPYLTTEENIALPMTMAGAERKAQQEWTKELLDATGLYDHRKHKLAQLSGGQQQRVAIAIALANRPTLLLGDEPTGELDSATADDVLALFQTLNERFGLTTVIVTHDQQVARAVNRVITVRDGRTSSETVRRSGQKTVASEFAGTTSFDEYVVIDQVGRLQIPPEIQEKVQIGKRATLSLTEDGDILIKRVEADRLVEQAMPNLPEMGDGAGPNITKRTWKFWKR